MANPKTIESTFVMDGKKAFSDALADAIDSAVDGIAVEAQQEVNIVNVLVAAMEGGRYAVRIAYRLQG